MSNMVYVCTGKSCTERHSKYIITRLESDIKRFDDTNEFKVETCLCKGMCKEGPVVLFDKEMVTRMNPIKASEMLIKRIEQYKQQKKKNSI